MTGKTNACSKTSSQPSLFAPNAAISGSVLAITNPAANGSFVSEYKIYSGTTLLTETSLASVDLASYLTTPGTYQITVKCSGTDFSDSAASNGVSYTVAAAAGYTLTVCHEPWADNAAYLYLSFDGGSTWESFDNFLNGDAGIGDGDGKYCAEIPNVSVFKAYYSSSVPVDYAYYTVDGSSPNPYYEDQVRVDIKNSVSAATAATVNITGDTTFTFIIFES